MERPHFDELDEIMIRGQQAALQRAVLERLQCLRQLEELTARVSHEQGGLVATVRTLIRKQGHNPDAWITDVPEEGEITITPKVQPGSEASTTGNGSLGTLAPTVVDPQIAQDGTRPSRKGKTTR